MKVVCFIGSLLFCVTSFAGKIIVAKDGSGDYKTVQAAINAVENNKTIIFIKNGVYQEKIYIEKSGITLEGESREGVVITASISRDIWRCQIKDDWGVATFNILADEVTLKNLTITNAYGLENEEQTIFCATDTLTQQKKVRKDGHQMALRTNGLATKLRAFNCRFVSYGGDTVSPWEVNNGMWYFKDCVMEGAVDLFCPRGWAWAENCEFIANGGSAIIWHDGSVHKDSKMVLKNCTFSGYDNFYLGRYHRDAQMYLIDCSFAGNMRDAAIYHAASGQPLQWGHRIYYADCKKQNGKEFDWYKNNLPNGIKKTEITVDWVFGERWNPVL